MEGGAYTLRLTIVAGGSSDNGHDDGSNDASISSAGDSSDGESLSTVAAEARQVGQAIREIIAGGGMVH